MIFFLINFLFSNNSDFEKCKAGDSKICVQIAETLSKDGNIELANKIYKMSCDDFKDAVSCKKQEKINLEKELSSHFNQSIELKQTKENDNKPKSYSNEIFASSDFGLPFFRFNYDTSTAITYDTVNDSGFNIDTAFLFYVNEQVAIGVSPFLSYRKLYDPYSEMDIKGTILSFSLFTLINSSNDIMNSHFFMLGFGLWYYKVTGDDGYDTISKDDFSFIIPVKFGKRFKITEAVAYAPNFAFELMLSPLLLEWVCILCLSLFYFNKLAT